MVRTRNQPASPQKDIAETKPRARRNGKKSDTSPQNGAQRSKSSSSADKTTSRKEAVKAPTPAEADEPEDILPISRRGLRSHGKTNFVTLAPQPKAKTASKRKQPSKKNSEKKAVSVTSSLENHQGTESPNQSREETSTANIIPKIVVDTAGLETERLSDSSDDGDSAPGPRSPVKIPLVKIHVASPKKNDGKNERKDIRQRETKVLSAKLNVSLRDRIPSTSKKSVKIKKEDDSGSDFDVDDNADFDFSDKDSDFDIDKELETRPKKKRNLEAESESEDDFEEVADKHVESDEDDLLLDRSLFASTSKGPLEITVDLPDGGGRKKEMDKDKWIAAQLRRRDKDMKMDIHKVHLLCGISHGFYLNEKIGRNQELLALALSVWNPSRLSKPADYAKMDSSKLHELVASIKDQFSFAHHLSVGMCSVNAFKNAFWMKQCPSYLHMTMIVLLMLRSLGLEVRLVYSMQPVPVKETKAAKTASATKRKTTAKLKKVVQEEQLSEDKSAEKPETKGRVKRGAARKRKRAQSESDEEEADEKKIVKRPARKAAKNAAGKGSAVKAEEDASNADVEMSEDESSEYGGEKNGKKKKTPAKKSSANKDIKEDPKEATGNLLEVPKAESVKGSPSTSFVSASSDISYKSVAKEKGIDYWVEVYCGKSKSYVPVHCISGEVGVVADIERSATQPLQYVVAFGEKSSLKDVTPVYAAEWLTINRKLQVDVDWWKDQVDTYRPLDKKKDAAEDKAIHELLLQRPRPDIPQLYKGHPLYILRPHLAKYEALYPPNPIPVDEVKDEPVYLRECAKLLHTRENWLREAKTVKKGEKPYKEVKKVQRKKKVGRRGRNDPNALLMAQIAEKEVQKVEMVGLFGEWQVEDFVPPVAENGKVPRNSYGNVELYQQQMLPIGCSYINIKGNGLNRVAKKLDIDLAAAVTGWEFQGWRAHPVIEGWVVCKEYEKELMKAWKKEEIEIEKRARERKSKKAMDNWKKIFKGLALKRKLQMKYGVDFTASEKLKIFIRKTDMAKVESDEE